MKLNSGYSVGQKIENRYTVLRSLGCAGYFATYIVYDEKLNKQWMMKICDKCRDGYSEKIRDIILSEPYMLKKFDHPAIPRLVDIIEDDDSIKIISEYIEGETLDTMLRDKGALSQDTVADIAKQLCDVLGYLHKRNPPYIYGDMKPANVLMRPCGNVQLVEFGTVAIYDAIQKNYTCVMSTMGYAAPEQFSGNPDPRSDIYALGVTLYHLVTGADPTKPPYEIKPIREINPKLSCELEAIILRCTQMNPEDRFQNCDELMAALQGGPIYPPVKKGFLSKLFGRK